MKNRMELSIGNPAPGFTLQNQNGGLHSLSDYLGKWVLLYFYPKDFTSGCTTQACGIRDNWQKIQLTGLAILGISGDSVDQHRKFIAEHKLPFDLLSDESKNMIASYGALVEKEVSGKIETGISRDSFIIDPAGKIAKIYRKVSPSEYINIILKDFGELKTDL
jgi:thioredoxin-dependent peroxiredoxin